MFRKLDDAQPRNARYFRHIRGEDDAACTLLQAVHHSGESLQSFLANKLTTVVTGTPNGLEPRIETCARDNLAIAMGAHQHRHLVPSPVEVWAQKMLAVPERENDRPVLIDRLVKFLRRINNQEIGSPHDPKIQGDEKTRHEEKNLGPDSLQHRDRPNHRVPDQSTRN